MESFSILTSGSASFTQCNVCEGSLMLLCDTITCSLSLLESICHSTQTTTWVGSNSLLSQVKQLWASVCTCLSARVSGRYLLIGFLDHRMQEFPMIVNIYRLPNCLSVSYTGFLFLLCGESCCPHPCQQSSSHLPSVSHSLGMQHHLSVASVDILWLRLGLDIFLALSDWKFTCPLLWKFLSNGSPILSIFSFLIKESILQRTLWQSCE